jgi:predicted ester cyclase
MSTETTQVGSGTAAVARAYLEAVGRRERDAQTRFYAPDAKGRIYGVIGPAGIEEFQLFFGGLYDAFPDFSLEVIDVASEGDKAALRWRATGTFSGPGSFMGLDPTGRSIELEGIDMVWVRDGKVARVEAYMDGMTLARQLGALPAKDSAPDRLMLSALNAVTKAREALRNARSQ